MSKYGDYCSNFNSVFMTCFNSAKLLTLPWFVLTMAGFYYSYFGSASHLYQRMPMGLNVSPLIWQSYINTILNSLQRRKYCEVIMDDLLLFTPSKIEHTAKLEDLLKALRKNGLIISPKKCQLFRTELQYTGNTIFINEGEFV